MSKKEDDKIRELQSQWLFLVLGGMIAVFLGLSTNALYDILREQYTAWGIFLSFGFLASVLIDIFSYMFDRLKWIRENPNESLNGFLWKYVKYRVSRIFWLKNDAAQRGYIGLLMLLAGTGLALYLYMEYSPLGKGGNDATLSDGVEAKGAAMQVQGMADDRNAVYEREMNQ